MEYILSVEEMRKADSIAINELKIPGLILMENAGLKTAQCVAEKYKSISGKTIGIFCGKGNNGGDGFVIGRHLFQMGATVTFWLTRKKKDLQGDAKTNMEIADQMNLPIFEISYWDPEIKLNEFDLLIDALLGTGLKGDVRGIYADVIKTLNLFQGPVIAVDAPSGLDCDTGKPLGCCVEADLTVTMGNIKSGMLFYPGRSFLGDLFITDLSVPSFVFDQINPQKFTLELEDYKKLLPDRPEDAYKNTFGKVLVIAGSTGLTGAASLCSLAVLRSGAGMVVLGCPKSLNSIFENKLTEVMNDPLPETDQGSLSVSAFNALKKSLDWSNVIALGPGLSTHPETKKLCQRILQEINLPMVIDADGLNNLADSMDLLVNYKRDLILTPHIGELARLTKMTIYEIQNEPIEVVRRFAKDWGVVLLLKGAPTIIGDPDGNIYFNLSGNAGMATAGSGDVLTGLISGFLAQGVSAINAAILGAFVHGFAGDSASKLLGQRGALANDILKAVPLALEDLGTVGFEFTPEYYRSFGSRLF